MKFYTYLHCKPNGEPFYVGKGHGARSRVFAVGRNLIHRRIVAKYGVENIGIFEFPCDSEQEAFSDEIQQISQLRSDGYRLANICDGGEGPTGRIASDKTRARISSAQMGRKWSEASIAKRSATNRGSKRSAETRARMSASNMGKIVGPETRAKLSALNRGRTHTPEARAKISAAHMGQKHALGYRHTPEALEKISAASKAFKRTPEHCANISAALLARSK